MATNPALIWCAPWRSLLLIGPIWRIGLYAARREWPVMSDRVPWYPNLRALGKDGREWDAVLDESWIALRGLMADQQGRDKSISGS